MDRTAEPKKRGPAAKVGGFVVVLFVAALSWHVASDLIAPSSSSGAVSALTTQIAARVAGQVEHVHVSDNQRVARGDPLFTLDPAPFDLAVRQAQVALDQALLSVGASSVNLAGAQAQVDQARATLENNRTAVERARNLAERGLSTQAQLDTAELQYASAVSALNSAEASLEAAQLQVGDGSSPNPQIEGARVQLEQAQLNRTFATVVAPADGVITNLRMSTGQFVSAGSPALTFIESEQPWVTVDLRENQLINVDVGDRVSVIFDAVPGRSFEGEVRGLAWGIDPGRTAANGLPQNQSSTRWFEPARTIPVQISVDTEEAWLGKVRVGSKASALIFAQGEDNPVAWISRALQTVQSYLSYLF
ncbi:HlyD family secretion protein [Devosia crocina]|nr:HlyD family secretion protein [Devosia crocina]